MAQLAQGAVNPVAQVAQGAVNAVVQQVASRDPVVRQVVQTVQDPGFQQVRILAPWPWPHFFSHSALNVILVKA